MPTSQVSENAAAVYSLYRTYKLEGYAEKISIAQFDIRVSDFRCVSKIFLVIIGCSRMLLIFPMSQSEQNFPL